LVPARPAEFSCVDTATTAPERNVSAPTDVEPRQKHSALEDLLKGPEIGRKTEGVYSGAMDERTRIRLTKYST
jgi:hypothetical protein